MAEQLGEASLRLTLDTAGLDAALKAAKAKIEGELGGTIQKAAQKQTGQKPGGTAGGLSAELKASAKILALRNSINILETKGSSVSQFRARLSEIEAAAANRQFKAVAQQGEALRQLVSAEQNRLQVAKNITTENEKQRRQQIKIARENAVPVSGVIKTPGLPAFQIPGSPGIRGGVSRARLRTLTGISGEAGLSGVSQRDLVRRFNLRGVVRTLETFSTEIQSSTAGKRLNLRSSWNKFFQDAEQVRKDIAQAGEDARKKASRERQKSAQAATKAAEKARREAGTLRRDVAANALIGVGFPLLFGQGPGAALGGGLGGAAGAFGGGTFGFAGSIAGTALGAAFDTALKKGLDLATALEDPIKNFDLLKENALLSSRSVEKQAEALIASGRNAEAYALIQQDIANTFGNTSELAEYRNAVDELNREWTRAGIEVAKFTAGPLAEFLQKLRLALGARPKTPEEQGQRGQLSKDLSAAGLGIAAAGGVAALTPAAPLGLLGLGIGAALVGLGEQLSKEKTLTEEIVESRKEWAKVLKEGGRAVVAAAVQFEDLKVSSELRSVIEEFKNIPNLAADFRFLQPQEQQAALAGLSVEDRKRVDELRIKEFSLTKQLTDLDQKRADAVARLNTGFANTLTLLSAQKGIYRQTLKNVQDIQDGIQEAQQQRDAATADITLARSTVDESNVLDLGRLLERQRAVNLEFANTIAKASLQLTEAGENLRDTLRQAVLDFTAIRSDPQGLNRFLGQADINRRAQEDFALLLPQFRLAQQQFQQLTGAPAREFAGRTSDVNASIRDFIDRVTREREAALNLAGAQQSLAQVNTQLVAVNTQLATATQALAAKDWTVNVQVNNQAGGASTVNAINGLA